jgi:pimeloyl-ACP methyl ester carboxylesterase
MNKLLKDSTINKDTFSDEDINLYTEEIKKPGAFQAALNYYRAAFKYPLKNQKKKIQIPSLLIWGENDAVFDISLTKGMDSFFEQPLKINYIPACSHWVQEEQPEIVNQLLLDFLLKSL